jgi:AcrR family transcriptional regulator
MSSDEGHQPVTSTQVMTRRQSSRGTERKRRIIEVATRMFARNGSRGTTLGEIAAEVGVSQAAVVYHFGTKEGLLNAVLDNRDQFEDTQLWRSGPDPGLEIFRIVADIVSSWADHPDIVGLLAVLLAENVADDGPLRPRLRANYQLTVQRIADTLGNAQRRGEMRADADPLMKATEFLAFISGLELAWIVSPDIPAAQTASGWAEQQISWLRAGAAGAAP